MVLTQDQIEAIRARLAHDLEETKRELARIDEQVRSVGESDDDSPHGVDNHPGDEADVLFEQERLLSVRERLADRQALILLALEKMDRGKYGYCEECGRPIAPERLEALPFARYCIECQSKIDQQQGGRW
ncbi:MAG: TraR/DksA C4-type zinc finger protein [Sphaerobacter sp.]|nr:TraR/DksA C4-type zinc finger protein [Sphaerobacter sp.]